MKKEQNTEGSTKQGLTMPIIKGSISIVRNGRPTQRAIKSKSKWFNGCQFFTVKSDEEGLTISKHWMEIPKSAHRYSSSSGLKVEMDLPCGDFVINEEESNEDKLVVYFI